MTNAGAGNKDKLVATGSLVVALGVMAAILLIGPGVVAAAVPESWAPLQQEAAFTLAIYGAMIVVALVAGAVLRRNVAAVGPRPVPLLGIGMAIGLAGIFLASGFTAIAGALRYHSSGGHLATLLGGLLLVLVQATAEEVYFRGWLQPLLARAWGVIPAIALTALSFAGLHMLGAAAAPLSFLNLLLGGLLFGALAARGGGLAAAIGAHLAWNGTEQLLLGLDPNPGVGSFGSLFDLDLLGPSIWGGSAEGLNASLAMAMALVVLLVPMAMLARSLPSSR